VATADGLSSAQVAALAAGSAEAYGLHAVLVHDENAERFRGELRRLTGRKIEFKCKAIVIASRWQIIVSH
jgi:hypothetical protein